MNLPSFKEFIKLKEEKEKKDKDKNDVYDDEESIPEKAKKAKIDIYP